MLTFLHVSNFKSIGEEGVQLDLKPITILTGPNGSGKSSILESMCLLSQSVDSQDLVLHGDFVGYRSMEHIFHKGELGRKMRFAFGLRPTEIEIAQNPGLLPYERGSIGASYSIRRAPAIEVEQSVEANETPILGVSW